MRRLATLISMAAAAVAAACGPPFVAGTGTAGGGTTGDTTTTSTGTGAPLCMPGSCPDGQYCDAARGCTACSDFGTFALGEVKPAGVPTDASATPLYPRVGQDDTDLFFAQIVSSQGNVKRVAESGGSWTNPAAIMNLDSSGSSDTGPLFLAAADALSGFQPPELAGASVPILLFHTTRGTKKVEVYGLPLMQAVMPVQLQLPDTSDYVQDVVVAAKATPPRLWWLHGSDPTALGLVTMTGADPAPEDVIISLDTCAAVVQQPWVTPDGTRLLFSAKKCDQTGPHLFIAELGTDGKQIGKARRVFPGDSSLDYSPSLSTDLCTVLFSRQDANGKTAIVRANRP